MHHKSAVVQENRPSRPQLEKRFFSGGPIACHHADLESRVKTATWDSFRERDPSPHHNVVQENNCTIQARCTWHSAVGDLRLDIK
jgi:hypothetical protein